MKGLTWRTAGESHGPALVGIMEGLPAGMPLDMGRVDAELIRRQGGYGRGGRMKIETDRAQLLAGTRAGLTIAAPLALQLINKDAVIEQLPVPTNPRPGHADLAGCQKITQRDPRAILERASARETAMRVALGGVARQFLESFGIELFAHVTEFAGIPSEAEAFEAAKGSRAELRAASPFYSLDPEADVLWKARTDEAREARDTLGGIFEVRVHGLPPGLGSHASGPERLTARLGAALFSIPAMKGVEFGIGFEVARRPGSEVHDPIYTSDVPGEYGRFVRRTNRVGGLEGGMTNGEPLIARVAMKPIPSLRAGVPTVDFETGEAVRATYQRSDVTSVPAASVVGEAVLALELASAFLEKFGGDHMDHVRDSFGAWKERVRRL
ncbi:MAG: chorismate synthase [Planctomycetota bacterium]|jgi:chorismate synthase